MKGKIIPLLYLLFLTSLLLAACASPATPAPTTQAPTAAQNPTPLTTDISGNNETLADVAFKITGAVAQEMGWTEEEIRAMDTTEAVSTNSQGQADSFTGVLISTLLTKAQPTADATTLIFVGDDGTTAEQPLADIQACADCLISFRTKGGFSVVLPGFSDPMPIKGVVEIQVK